MIWGLEEFLDMEIANPGCVFGQLDLVCLKCNCAFEAEFDDGNDLGYECPNCGELTSQS